MLKTDFLNKLTFSQKEKYDYSLVEEDIIGCHAKIKIICTVCNIEFEQNFRSHINGHGCRSCQYKKNSLEKNDGYDKFVEKAIKTHGNQFDYSETIYVHSGVKVLIKCNSCGEVFLQSTTNHLSGHGCSSKKCINYKISIKKKKSKDAFLNESIIRFGNIFLYSNYVKKHDIVFIECLKCKYKFKRNGRDHLESLGCPNCSDDKSHGERLIKEFLESKQIVFEREKTFPDLRGTSKYAIFRFDFYLPTERIAIEFDGIHHFEYHPFSKDENKPKPTIEEQQKCLDRVQMNDKMKDDYCLKNNITMIRIRYDDHNFRKRLDYEFKKSKLSTCR